MLKVTLHAEEYYKLQQREGEESTEAGEAELL